MRYFFVKNASKKKERIDFMLYAYVAGAYTAPTEEQKIDNVMEAHIIGMDLISKGFWPFMPTKNTFDMEFPVNDIELEDIEFYRSGLAWMLKCDVVVLCPNWVRSRGAKMEITFWTHFFGRPREHIFFYPDLPDPGNFGPTKISNELKMPEDAKILEVLASFEE
jgi:hypothetical protein